MSDVTAPADFSENRILVVDDNPVNRKLLASIVRKAGYEVVTATGGEECLVLARKYPFDLILLDIIMPGIDGFAVCKSLQHDPRTINVPIIMVSSLDISETKIQCFDLGAVDYITKPFHKGEVLARIRSQLGIKNLTASLLKSNEQLQDRQNVIDQDLMAAAAIQRALLPELIPFTDSLQTHYTFRPCERIGGDIFNIFALDDFFVGIYIVDVCGHGVPAAMIATLVSQAMSLSGNVVCTFSKEEKWSRKSSPLQVLERLDRLFPIERFDRYFTISYMVLDLRDGSFSYSSAGHPPILHQKKNNGDVVLLEVGGPIIGLGEFAPQREEGSGQLASGDRLFFYTDGIVELENTAGEMFGVERVELLIKQQKDILLSHYSSAINQGLQNFSSDITANDDISLLCLEYLG